MQPGKKSNSLISNLSWSPDDREIIVCYFQRNPRILDMARKRPPVDLNFDWLEKIMSFDMTNGGSSDGGPAINEVPPYVGSWSPNGMLIALGAGNEVHVIDRAARKGCHRHVLIEEPPEPSKYLARLQADPVLSRLPMTGSRA